MIIFKNNQLKANFPTFWIIGLIYLLSISQISSKNLQKTIFSKNKSFITNNTISALLNTINLIVFYLQSHPQTQKLILIMKKNQKEKQIIIIQTKTIIVMDMEIILQVKILLITIQKIK